MHFKLLLLAALVLLFSTATHASVGGYICPNDRKKLLTVLVKALINVEGDFSTPYYGIKGFKALNEQVAAVLVKDNCAHIKKYYKADCTPEENFQGLSAWNLLGCSGKLHTDATITNLRTVLESDKSTTSDIRYAAETLKLLGAAIPNGAKVAQLIQAKLKEDDSLQSLGHALHAAALLGTSGNFIQDRIEEVVVQADEVDGKLLQWEGGLTTTSLLITGLLRFPGAKPLNAQQAEKLATYLLTRRTVQTPKGALALLEATTSLASSDISPVSITIAGPAQVTLDKPELKVHISDILGRALKAPPTPVVAQSATRITDDVVVLSKQPLSPGGTPVEFVLPLRLEPGQYRIALTAGSHSTTLTVRVLGPVTLEWLQIGLGDADGSAAPRLTKLTHPSKLPSPLRADSSHHLVAKFAISRVVHQAFLRLYSGKKEIIFVAEPDNSKLYKISVNLASELAHSGTFEMELILGDSVMSNPIRWVIGTIEVSLSTPEPEKKSLRGPKPEIKHLFRQPEKRPAEVVSMLFTGLTVSPLLLLFVLWWKVGVNFGGFTTLSVPFHVGFGGILYLFFLFWWKLDMFTTCAWLIPIGGFTFLAGHKLLSHVAKHKKA
ncbi:dolichyl-diphosphooligosaccharide--protein glycosyltransferase subunit 2 [Tribolium castaneum]|uniref:Dolichyl-diphosphooligosaccharide--protein glycosyltransferase subunit 2 n=1 Tax=Tribolium castaneum TaxID=7070 RepID=D6WKN3_TRICA|nr:PREDICTED: dolichyl-diphosphooligosaccharide--protein glycosyltransferase subunit 2 [Tribolium castaneum]EFA03003.1 Dolichyl-diphosphooligosaccharide--protein glycosyltransferase subunit 2-like Protein [Tribolium castaneum]|eukprot:XP_971377.1 PREDICTED: dolichyl-diphosphooligosaccharide--protein glycosyltransferase subunit 2 [Tribolium castaneum]